MRVFSFTDQSFSIIFLHAKNLKGEHSHMHIKKKLISVLLKNKKVKERIAQGRIKELNAISLSNEDMNYRRNAINLMENIAKRMDISLKKNIKRNYCKNCKTPYGDCSRVRLKKNCVVVTCLECGDIRRFRYRP